jgi:hypothetical protein
LVQAIFDAMPFVVWTATLLSIFVFAPLGIFRKTRAFAGTALIYSSYILGSVLWIYGAVATFTYWGGGLGSSSE